MTNRSAMQWTAIAVVLGMIASCRDDSPSGPAPGGESSSTSSDPGTTAGTLPTTADASAEGADGSGGAVDSSSGGPSAPPCEDACIAVPPAWNGPVAVMRTSTAEERPSCPDAYPELVDNELFTELSASDLLCTCACEPTEIVCPTHVLLTPHGDDEDCESPGTGYNITTVCNSGPMGQNGYWHAAPVDVTSGECTPVSERTRTPAGFATRWTLCEGEPSEGACGTDETCAPAPAPFEERLCIWSEGDHECPSEGFAVRELVHASFDDQRGCAECSCGSISGTCGGGLRLWGANTCPEGGIEDILTTQVGDCVLYDAQAAKLLNDGLEPNEDVECPASTPAPTGEAVPTDPVTVCCSAQ